MKPPNTSSTVIPTASMPHPFHVLSPSASQPAPNKHPKQRDPFNEQHGQKSADQSFLSAQQFIFHYLYHDANTSLYKSVIDLPCSSRTDSVPALKHNAPFLDEYDLVEDVFQNIDQVTRKQYRIGFVRLFDDGGHNKVACDDVDTI